MQANSSQPQEDRLTLAQMKILASELHEFKKSALYQHYINHFLTLHQDTVDRIVEEPIKGPETIYTREAWIGEARTAKLNLAWFDTLSAELETAIRESEEN